MSSRKTKPRYSMLYIDLLLLLERAEKLAAQPADGLYIGSDGAGLKGYFSRAIPVTHENLTSRLQHIPSIPSIYIRSSLLHSTSISISISTRYNTYTSQSTNKLHLYLNPHHNNTSTPVHWTPLHVYHFILQTSYLIPPWPSQPPSPSSTIAAAIAAKLKNMEIMTVAGYAIPNDFSQATLTLKPCSGAK